MRDFQVGIITKPHGIKGELRVFPTTESPERFRLLVGKMVTVGEGTYTITGAKVSKGMAIVSFSGIGDRNATEKLLGQEIFITEDLALPLSEDEYYERDLIGMGVCDESGNFLGNIESVMKTPANDVYVVKPPEGKAYMFPAVKEVVMGVSVSKKKMCVNLPPGMKELTV